MKTKIISIILVLVALFALTSCKKDGFNYDSKYKYDGISLIGKWQSANPDHSAYSVYEFEGGRENYNNATVTVYIYGIEAVRMEATYRVEDNNTLVLDFGDGLTNTSTERYKFSISDSKIYINDSNKTTLEPYNLNYNQDQKIYGTWRDTEATDNIWSFLPDYSGLVTDTETTNNNLEYVLYKADKLSRNCFACKMYDACYWTEETKNHTILV